MSFFGGDHTKAHFSVHVPYFFKLPRAEQKSARDAVRAKLKPKGIKTERYFQFTVGDESGKAAAEAAAREWAFEVFKETGAEMEVSEGCFL